MLLSFLLPFVIFHKPAGFPSSGFSSVHDTESYINRKNDSKGNVYGVVHNLGLKVKIKGLYPDLKMFLYLFSSKKDQSTIIGVYGNANQFMFF